MNKLTKEEKKTTNSNPQKKKKKKTKNSTQAQSNIGAQYCLPWSCSICWAPFR